MAGPNRLTFGTTWSDLLGVLRYQLALADGRTDEVEEPLFVHGSDRYENPSRSKPSFTPACRRTIESMIESLETLLADAVEDKPAAVTETCDTEQSNNAESYTP